MPKGISQTCQELFLQFSSWIFMCWQLKGQQKAMCFFHCFVKLFLICISGAWLASTAELVGPCSSLHIRRPFPPVPKPSTIPLTLWPKDQQLYTAGNESFTFPEMFYSWFPSLPKLFHWTCLCCSVQGRCQCSPGSHRLCPTSALGISSSAQQLSDTGSSAVEMFLSQ